MFLARHGAGVARSSSRRHMYTKWVASKQLRSPITYSTDFLLIDMICPQGVQQYEVPGPREHPMISRHTPIIIPWYVMDNYALPRVGIYGFVEATPAFP